MEVLGSQASPGTRRGRGRIGWGWGGGQLSVFRRSRHCRHRHTGRSGRRRIYRPYRRYLCRFDRYWGVGAVVGGVADVVIIDV